MVLVLLALLVLSGCQSSQWSLEDTAVFTAGPAIDGGLTFVTASRYGISRQLRAYDARNGDEMWQVELGGWEDFPHLLAVDGSILVANRHVLMSFEGNTGRRSWRSELPGPLQQPLQRSSRVVVCLSRMPDDLLELELVSLNAGALVHRSTLPPSSVVGVSSARILIGVSEQPALISKEADTGNQLWRVNLESPPLLVLPGEAIDIVVSANNVLGMDSATGALRWSLPTDGQVALGVRGDNLAFGQRGELVSIDGASGEIRWHQRVAGMVAAPMLSDDWTYVHTAGGVLHALSPASGEFVWKIHVGPPGESAVFSDGVYVWVTDGGVKMVDLSKREVIAPVKEGTQTGSASFGGTRVVTAGGAVFGVSREHHLFGYHLDR